MASQRSIYPVRDEIEANSSPATVALEDADDVIDALTSETARTLVEHLYEEPATASDLATTVGTSIQNAQYHLERLQAAGVVEVIDTWYSERGTEMDVYGPKNDPLVVFAGESDSEVTGRRLLSDSSL